MKLSDDGTSVTGNKIKENCECLGISGGWTPMVHLFTQSGGKLKFNEIDNIFIPDKGSPDQISIGSCNGDFELDDVLKNSNNLTKNFIASESSEFDNLNVDCSKEINKKITDKRC